jgi:uncharacterized protein YbjT (DUF2867 family)
LNTTRAEDMPQRAAENTKPPILLTGATGYVGGLLLGRLESEGERVRCLVRSPAKLPTHGAGVEVCTGDVMRIDSLPAALQGVQTAYYLVHCMASSKAFETADREAAQNFGTIARQCGVQRIIYLGGLGDESDPSLSPHLRSRHEVGRVLADSGVETIEFRASAVIGTGSLSFEMIRTLTNRLPIMICPRWLSTPTQPIAIADLLAYLCQARHLPATASRIFEIGGSDVVTYGELIQQYARQQGKKRWLISVPVLSPYLSGLWLNLVTPATAEVGRHLIEGLRNPTIVTDHAALQTFPTITPLGTQAAIRQALEPGGLA